jgi:hypothetical protein
MKIAFWRKPAPTPIAPPRQPDSPLISVMKKAWTEDNLTRKMIGHTFTVPIQASYKPGWNQAVAWLEAREEAETEWPWPA